MTDPTMRVEGAGGSGASIFSVETLTGLTSSIASLHVEIEKSLSSQGLARSSSPSISQGRKVH
jgi:hypothetical protein